MERRLLGLAMFAGGMGLIAAGIFAKRGMDATWLLMPLHTLAFFGGLMPGLLLMTSQEWEPHTRGTASVSDADAD